MPSLESTLHIIKRLVPGPIFLVFRPWYHRVLAILGAVLYGIPGRHISVVGVTGTKGKSSTIEFLNAIFEEAGYATAIASTIRFKIASDSKPNLLRMTMAGRFFLQRFLRSAVKNRCDIAFLELTSEGAKQYRHWFLAPDALIFTNLSPEHIESHGSMEAYAKAKLAIGESLVRSRKRPRIIIANSDDQYGSRFLTLPVDQTVPFSLSLVEPYSLSKRGGEFTFEEERMSIQLPGIFSIMNAAAAASLASAFGIDTHTIKRGLAKLHTIPGRAQELPDAKEFTVVIDYAHTPDSLRAIYDAYDRPRRICVLGATGGGRDHWKRPVMGSIAEEYCDIAILTNEDPYDESPQAIVDEIASGFSSKKPHIVLDRREAIREAIRLAKAGDVVLITGKGTDPNICGPRGTKTPWSDFDVARDEYQSAKKEQRESIITRK
jgi:UDP-N-acetylmuramoyl-L-alanyl-D-glutamate--2,6-diaminopimelate ligase